MKMRLMTPEAIKEIESLIPDHEEALIGVSVGAIFGVVIAGGFEVINLWKDKKKTEKQIKEFNTFVKEEIES